jgi:Tfp pilus assembly protein PilN
MIEINLIPEKIKKQKQLQLVYAAGVAVGIVVVSALIGFYIMQKKQIANIDLEIKKIDAESASLTDKIAEVKKYQALKDVYDKKKGVLDKLLVRQAVWMRILDRVGEMVYPDMWLTELGQDKTKEDGIQLNLTGYAPSRSMVADFIKRLEESPDISDISAVRIDEEEKYNTGWVVFQVNFIFKTVEKKQAAV